MDILVAVLKWVFIILIAGFIGQFGKNKMVGLLPMTVQSDAKLALRRTMKLLHSDPIEVDGILLTVKIAGVSTTFDADKMLNAGAFLKIMSNDLTDMVVRVKHIQELL